MAKMPEIIIKDLPEVKRHIKKLRGALIEVKELVKQGRYYRVGSVVDKALENESQRKSL